MRGDAWTRGVQGRYGYTYEDTRDGEGTRGTDSYSMFAAVWRKSKTCPTTWVCTRTRTRRRRDWESEEGKRTRGAGATGVRLTAPHGGDSVTHMAFVPLPRLYVIRSAPPTAALAL